MGPRQWALATFLSAAQLLLVGVAAASVDAPFQLLAVAALAPLPIIVGAAASTAAGRRADRRSDLDVVQTLAARVELAEAILAREQERMHQLRATVASVALSHRLLSEDGARLSRSAKRRLERLREAELARIERLLADAPREPVGPVDLAAVLDPLVDGVRLQGHSVVWEGTRCRALGRADDIAEIAQILLDNAARHAGGQQIVVEVDDSGDRIDLRVRDGGPGVAPTLAPVVFERGIRATSSHGEGIGLHIARRLALDLGGDLRLESTPGSTGAVFVLQLLEPTGVAPCLAPAV